MSRGESGQKLAPGSEPLYSPADSHGHFATLVDDDIHPAGLAQAYDLDELELDPSERRPGGPVAEAVLALPPAEYAKKWAVPLLGFLSACLLQSIGLFSASCRYVKWMDRLADDLEGPTAASSDSRGVLRNATGSQTVVDAFKLQDPFADNFARPGATSPSPLFSFLTAAMPVVCVVAVARSKNLRIWTRTLLVGTILALLNAFLTWMTVVPGAAGWADCLAQLDKGFVHETRHDAVFLGVLGSILRVLWIWVASFFSGLHAPPSLACGGMILSGPTYFNTLCALALYDGGRMATRKLKPHFRLLYRLFFGIVLTILVVTAAHWELMSRQQYSAAVVLAIIFTLLLYGSPPVAICVDRWLTFGSPNLELLASGTAQLNGKDPYDAGDVVVPICCLPFCCLHGRFFLYPISVEETEAALRSHEEREQKRNAELRRRAAEKAEAFRVAQEHSTARLVELDALIDAERQRAELREREDREQNQENNERTLAELQADFDSRVAKGLAAIEPQIEEQRQAARQLEERAQRERRRAADAEVAFDEQLESLTAKAEAAKARAAAKLVDLARLQEQAERELDEGEALAEELGCD